MQDQNSRQKVFKNKQQQLVDGKMPPQCIELEDAVLGQLMLDQNCINEISGILEPKSFYKDANCRVFSAIINLFRQSYPVDMLSVVHELKRCEELDIVGGAFYVTGLTNNPSYNAEYHARIIQQKFIQRELIRISTVTINNSYEDSADCIELLNEAEKNLYSITKNTFKKEPKTSSELSRDVIANLEKIMQRPDGLSGVPSGLQEVDKITGGWQNSDLVIIAARPAMGKTALVVTIAKNCAVMFKRPAAIFSLEMSQLQLMKRIISAEAEVNSEIFKDPKRIEDYQWAKINNAVATISNSPLFIDDTPSLSVLEFRAKARRLVEKYKVELIVVDYIQLMVGDKKGNREQEISDISRNLKAIAKELNVPIIALSQLSRAVETRGGDKRPMLSDLRESGAIEQDADIVIFIHRPEYYNITEDSQGNSTIGMGELIVAKHREGAVKSAMTRFIAQYTKFCDIDSFETESYKPKTGLRPNKHFEPETIEEENHPF